MTSSLVPIIAPASFVLLSADGLKWQGHAEASYEDGIWLGTAVAYCEARPALIRHSLRYGQSAGSALHAAIESLQEEFSAGLLLGIVEKEQL